jgi:hypothetical protein
VTEILLDVGLELQSNNFRRIRKRITLLGLNTSHFTRETDRNNVRTRWSNEDLRAAVALSNSIAEVIRKLGLIPAGGNYDQVQRRIRELMLDTSHFIRTSWNAGLSVRSCPPIPLEKVLVAGRWTQSHGLKQRLFREGLKQIRCELCGWAEQTADGRIPVELDHINGDKTDNRIENLRILCPNCHSIQPTHRGLNKKSRRAKS